MMKNKEINKENIVKKSNLLKLIKFNWSFVKRSVLFWIFFILFTVSNFASTLTLIMLDKSNVINFSFLNYLISFIFSIVFILFCVSKFFLEFKYSNVDISLNSKPFNKLTIYLSRFILILLIIFIINIFHFVTSSILALSFNFSPIWILYNLVSNIFINTFIATFSISLFILFAIYFKKAIFYVCGLITILLFSLPLVTRAFNTNNNLEYSANNWNSYVKLIQLKDNKTISIIAKKINYVSTIRNNQDVNSDNFWNYFIPGEWVASLNASLAANIFNQENNSNVKHKYSLTKTWYQNINYLNFANETIITILPKDENPFELSNTEYENLIFNYFDLKDNNNLNLSDQLLAESFLNKLKNTGIWNEENLSYKEHNTLFNLYGFNLKYSQLFYYWNYHWLLSNKTPNLIAIIEQKYGKNLADLIEYIYTSDTAYTNIYNFNVFGKVDQYYPNSMVVNGQKPINQYDLNFIINDLLRFNEGVVYYLDANNNYQITTLETIQKLSPSIVDFASWKQFVLENTITYDQAKSLINNIKSLLNNVYLINLLPNYFDPYQYSNYYNQSNSSYLSYNYLVLSLFICLALFINYAALYKFKQMNYKNIEM